ncbi:MAG: phosphopyruvate hydratase [Pyrodictiaceae archaeon]
MDSDERFLIDHVRARMILDSRGNPTVEVEVKTRGGGVGRAAAPAGASKGRYEALELRDGGKRFRGKGVSRAINNVNNIIAKEIIGMDARKQRLIDKKLVRLDGTPNKSRLGGNALTATSLAVAKAAASTLGLDLYEYLGGSSSYIMPVPMLNVINGGLHAGNNLSFQEFMIVPVGSDSFSGALTMAVEVYMSLREVLKDSYGRSALNVGDEGGFAPPMNSNREALDALMKAINRAGYTESDVAIAIDSAASQLYDTSSDTYSVDSKKLTREELLDYYIELVSSYPIVSIEDPFHEDDFEGFKLITEKLSSKILIVGDDLYATNAVRLKKGIEDKLSTAVLVKVNQAGTLTEAIDVALAAQHTGMRAIISHRSGETEDTAIAHIAVGLRTGLIKTGAPARGERTAKYNELLRIEEKLGDAAVYPGLNAFRPYQPLWLAPLL